MEGREKRERWSEGEKVEWKNALTPLAYTEVQLRISEQMHLQLPEYLVEKQVVYYHLYLAVEICSF